MSTSTDSSEKNKREVLSNTEKSLLVLIILPTITITFISSISKKGNVVQSLGSIFISFVISLFIAIFLIVLQRVITGRKLDGGVYNLVKSSIKKEDKNKEKTS